MLTSTAMQLIHVNGLETAYEIAVARVRAHEATGRDATHHREDAKELAALIDRADLLAKRLTDWLDGKRTLSGVIAETCPPLTTLGLIEVTHTSRYDSQADLWAKSARAVCAK